MSIIDSFSGDYSFLSNFYPVDVEFDGEVYPSVEHAYQAAKTYDISARELIRLTVDPGRAKQLGKAVEIHSEWDKTKISIMNELLVKKFQDPKLRIMLMNTEGSDLLEGNYWGDTFWGVCNGVGKNHLGQILMSIRNGIKLGIL